MRYYVVGNSLNDLSWITSKKIFFQKRLAKVPGCLQDFAPGITNRKKENEMRAPFGKPAKNPPS